MKFEVLKQSHLKRNIILGVVAVLIISAVVLTFTRAKYRVTESIPLVNGTINYTLPDIQIVALYINGEEAEELDSNTTYTLDTTNSTCTYKDGTTIDNLILSYDSNTGELQISPFTTKGTKCTLYFDEVQSASDTIENLYPDNQDILAYDDYGNLRYIGANPNNYVLFNNELWRIIGIFSEDTHGVEGEKLIKIIRDESIGEFSWDNKGYSSNDWSDSTLQVVLNEGAYYNRTSGTCPYGENRATTDCDFSTTGLTEEAKAMIETVTWKLGGLISSMANVNAFYTAERGTTVNSSHATEWVGEVGLVYPSDYGYATSGGDTCLSSYLYDWGDYYSNCYNNDWLYDSSSYQWTISQSLNSSATVFLLDSNGSVYDFLDAYSANGVRPTVYLKSNIVITGGMGSSSDPYILSES